MLPINKIICSILNNGCSVGQSVDEGVCDSVGRSVGKSAGCNDSFKSELGIKTQNAQCILLNKKEIFTRGILLLSSINQYVASLA